MAIEYVQKGDWVFIPAPSRLDSFNFESTKKDFEQIAAMANKIAIDVSTAHFISIPMIKFMHALAQDLAQKGGQVALVGPTEKLKRQIHIFASLEPFTLYKINADFL
jgi:anti-anti-sigma regulatory factor